MGLREGMLTLDVEDWEHANFHQLDGKESQLRELVKSRAYSMDRNTDLWLETLGAAGATSTCFVLGEFARRYPEAVKRLHAAGHEIASHGDDHGLVYRMSQEGFREWLKKALGTLGALTGRQPRGFRAPSWSVDDRRTPWLCEELSRAGLVYDSSEFPIQTPLYGQKGAPLKPYLRSGILRVPVTVLTLGGLRVPFASGAFFRLSPLPLLRFGLWKASRAGLPVMIVLHPRELDPEHPRLPLSGWESSVHYARLGSTLPKLRALLPRYRWVTVESYAESRRAVMNLAHASR